LTVTELKTRRIAIPENPSYSYALSFRAHSQTITFMQLKDKGNELNESARSHNCDSRSRFCLGCPEHLSGPWNRRSAGKHGRHKTSGSPLSLRRSSRLHRILGRRRTLESTRGSRRHPEDERRLKASETPRSTGETDQRLPGAIEGSRAQSVLFKRHDSSLSGRARIEDADPFVAKNSG